MLARQLGQVAAELVEQGRSGRALGAGGAGRGGGTLTSLITREELDDLLANSGQVGTQADENLGGDALALTHQTEQHVLGPDVVMTELQCLPQRQLEHLLGAGRERR